MSRIFNKLGKRELTFLAIAILISLLLLTYTIFTISFLVSRLNAVLRGSLIQPAETVRFNLEKFQDLEIGK